MNPKSNPVRILIADDHPLLREGIRGILENQEEFEVIGEAAPGDETITLCQENPPDVLLLDIKMPGKKTVEILRELNQTQPQIKTIILTAYDDETILRILLPFQIAGYVLKDEPSEILIDVIKMVAGGRTWFSPSVSEKFSEIKQSPWKEPITAREIEVLSLLKEGLSFEDAADTLGISVRTVRYHIEKINLKLNTKNRLEALAKAIESGLLEK
jgi:DNA-binding NarL/FixJ family response regulator